MEKISESDVKIEEIIYQQKGFVEVFRVTHIRTGAKICMKKLYVNDIMEATQLCSEFIAMAKLQHENIVSLLSASLGGQNREITHILIFMDYLNEGDLESFIIKQIKSRKYLPEGVILKYLSQLVDAYEYMEKQGIAHRDIKPQNIFVCNNGERLMVGDLGSAIKKEDYSTSTLVGTPMYLSPKLREALSKQNYGVFNLSHDVFKSDVFSLGLTFLYLASLTNIKDLCTLEGLDERIENRIHNLPVEYKVLKYLLSKMLQVDERKRSNFSQLKQDILRYIHAEALKVENVMSEIPKKLQVIIEQCKVCGNKCNETDLFVFAYCLICRNCVNGNLNHIPKIEISIFIDSSNTKVFNYESPEFCPYCKLISHPNRSCVNYMTELKKRKDGNLMCYWNCAKCEKSNINVVNNHYSILPSCSNFHSYCLVCLSLTYEKDHTVCKTILSSYAIYGLQDYLQDSIMNYPS